jgi:hypothetical protein
MMWKCFSTTWKKYFIHKNNILAMWVEYSSMWLILFVHMARIFFVVQKMKLTSSLLKLTSSCVSDVIIDETPTIFCMKDA